MQLDNLEHLHSISRDSKGSMFPQNEIKNKELCKDMGVSEWVKRKSELI